LSAVIVPVKSTLVAVKYPLLSTLNLLPRAISSVPIYTELLLPLVPQLIEELELVPSIVQFLLLPVPVAL